MDPRLTAAFRQAVSAFESGDFVEAAASAERVVANDASFADAWHLLARARIEGGDYAGADAAAAKFSALQPSALAFQLRTVANRYRGHSERALEFAEAGLSLEPSNRPLLVLKANILNTFRRYEEAAAALSPALVEDPVPFSVAEAFSRLSPNVGRRDEAILLMERQLATSTLNVQQKIAALLSLAEHKDALEEYDAAFALAQQANDLKMPRANLVEYAESLEAMLAAWSEEEVDRIASSTRNTDIPVYIVGMPRSGTSLVEQIVASHPAVFGGNERHDIRNAVREVQPAGFASRLHLTTPSALTTKGLDVLAGRILGGLRELAPKAQRITDKNPINYLHLGLISKLFPNARFIHCTRDPLDTGISCFMHNLAGPHVFNMDLRLQGRWHRQYERVMAHWERVLDIDLLEVRYEDLVADPEPNVRAMIDFLGLPWDDRCLSFHETVRTTLTPSADQVRRPMYSSSVGRWRNYESHLKPLIEALQ